MKFSLVAYVLVLVIVSYTAEAVRKLVDTINICKRSDPELSTCLLTNFNNVLPILKDGAPDMNVIPIDPFRVENMNIDFTQMQSMDLLTSLRNLTIYGWSNGHIHELDAWLTSNGIQMYVDLHMPTVVWQSEYNAVGNFLMIPVNTTGYFRGEFTTLTTLAIWNSTRYVKNDKEYLLYTGHVVDLTVEKFVMHFSNWFGNNAQLNEHINHMINENMDSLYEEIKPVMMEGLRLITQKIVNDFHETFPYDFLYPNV